MLSRDFTKFPLKRGELISKPDLEELYITQNLNRKEVGAFFGVGEQPVRRALRAHGIKKPAELYQQKAKTTCLIKYGVAHPLQSKEIQKKTTETFYKRHGVKNPFQAEFVKEKSKQTLQKRYGVSNCQQSEEVRAKAKDTMLKKYHTTSGMQCHMADIKTWQNDELFKNFVIAGTLGRKWYTAELAEHFNCTISPVQVKIGELNLWDYIEYKTSQEEEALRAEIEALGISTTKYRQAGLELDIYIKSKNIAIEFNGNYWHSTRASKTPTYHVNKSKEAEKRNIFLYHVFEYDWVTKKEVVLSQIRNLLGCNTTTVYARKCVLKEVIPSEAHSFLTTNHMQGSTASKINLGLYYNNELVSLMTFGKSRFNKNYEWELVRFCNKLNTTVVGGASKLFKHFVKQYKPTSMVSYSDIAHTKGLLYGKLGFTQAGTSYPNYVWVHHATVLSRYKCQKHLLVKRGFGGLGQTEREIMEARNFAQIFDCGSRVHVWSF